MAGLYSHTTRATGTVLTASIYNTDHQNHIDNQTPSATDDYSVNVAQMQSTISPGGVGSESLATNLAGELERLRHVIKTMHGGAQWYPGTQQFPLTGGADLTLTGTVTVGTEPATAMQVVPLRDLGQYISGLVPSTAADADHDTTISAGVAVDTTGVAMLRLSTAITKQIDAAWAVGTNAGGLDTGTVANDTWYYLWLISRSDTKVVDVLYSTSASAPTMPTNYDLKRLIGVVKTNGSANILAHFCSETAGGGLAFDFAAASVTALDYDSTLTTSPQTINLNIPTGISNLLVSFNIRATDTAANWNAIVSSVGFTPAASTAPLCTICGVTGATAAANVRMRVLGSSIQAESTLASIDSFRVCTLGFEMSRR